MTRAAMLLMRLLGRLPLPWLRAVGAVCGWLLYALLASRRRVALRNLELCFPQLATAQRCKLARRNFICFTQAWLDRFWLWHAPQALVARRVRLCGNTHELEGDAPTIIFAPHFYGMDAAGAVIAMNTTRPCISIYRTQRNAVVDAWLKRGRSRFGDVHMVNRDDGLRPVLARLRRGGMLYLLPDVNFGAEEAVFVPFFGIPAATITSLSRLARLGRARVVPVTARMTPDGYLAEVHSAWQNYPTDDPVADTARMNTELQNYIATMPGQYYWVHRRFKTRPRGEPALY